MASTVDREGLPFTVEEVHSEVVQTHSSVIPNSVFEFNMAKPNYRFLNRHRPNSFLNLPQDTYRVMAQMKDITFFHSQSSSVMTFRLLRERKKPTSSMNSGCGQRDMEIQASKYEPGDRLSPLTKDEDTSSDAESSSASGVMHMCPTMEIVIMNDQGVSQPMEDLEPKEMDYGDHRNFGTKIQQPSQGIFRFVSIDRRQRASKMFSPCRVMSRSRKLPTRNKFSLTCFLCTGSHFEKEGRGNACTVHWR